MKILILGSNGFIGYNLTKFLLSKNESIIVYNRSLNSTCPELPNIEYIYGDFANIETLKKALKNVDLVYHLISTTTPSTSNKNPLIDVNDNIINTLNLLNICLENGVKKIIFTSSGGTVYGVPQFLPITEDHPTDPICSYGITKLTIEKYLSLYHHLHHLNYSVLRIANVYGEGQNPLGKIGVIIIFLDRIKKGLPLNIWGDGNSMRDYVYISDVIDALYLTQKINLSEHIFNIGSGKGISINNLIEEIKTVINCDFDVNYLAARNEDVPINFLDISKAQKYLNWQPKVSLTKGIELTWNYLEKYDYL